MTKIPAIAFGVCLPLCLSLAAEPRQKVELVTTDRTAFAEGGVIQVEGSTGELNIEGWDQPTVQIVTTRYAFPEPAHKERTAARLKTIQVTARMPDPGELTVSTSKYCLPGVHLDYRIMVPRTSRLVIRHRIGDVIVLNVAGHIDAKVRVGGVTIQKAGVGL